jgi:hypothetical protein
MKSRHLLLTVLGGLFFTACTVLCAATTDYTISVSVTGLTSGSLVMHDNKSDLLTFTTNDTQTFATQYASGSNYTVTIKTQPTGQTCTMGSNSSGMITSDITVAVTCAKTVEYKISVAVTGLTGTLVVEDSKNSTLTFTTNTTQTFALEYPKGSAYTVTVETQPAGQTCTLSSNATGTLNSNITVTATCTTNSSNYTISVAVTGLTGTLVMQDSQSDTLTFTTNTTQTFAKSYASGSTYTVTVKTQPSGQTCTLSSNASGTITSNITVTATCTTGVVDYTISVAVTGLTGTLVVQDNLGASLTFTTNTTKAFSSSYASGSTYSVTVETQPAGQTCALSSNASGTITSNITVTATCTTSATYTIGGTVSGLTGTGLQLQDNGGNTLSVTANGSFTFSTKLPSGSTYDVTVSSQPTGQTCTPTNNTGTVGSSNVTSVVVTCSSATYTISVAVTGLTGSVELQDDQGATLTFSSNNTQTFSNTYASGAAYTVSITSQPLTVSCIPTYATGTITANITIFASCNDGALRPLGTVSNVSTVSCPGGGIADGVCQQMTVTCPDVPSVSAYVKTNTPTGTPLGLASYGTGTEGNGLYDTQFTYGTTAVGNVLDAGFITVQIDWGTPFNSGQPNGWVQGPGGVLAAACNYATVVQWIQKNIGTNTPNLPQCATGNSGGAGALAYVLSQYPQTLSMAEVTSGPPTGRLDWGCGCTEGKLAVQCGDATTLGTCFGKTDGAVWDGAYSPNTLCSTAAGGGALPPGGLSFFLGDSAEAPGANYNFPDTYVNLVFGGADGSSAIPIGQDWFNKITSSKAQVCVAGGMHSMADTLPGADQIANDLISLCKVQ